MRERDTDSQELVSLRSAVFQADLFAVVRAKIIKRKSEMVPPRIGFPVEEMQRL